MANLSALKAGGVPSTFCGHVTLAANDGDTVVTGVGFKPNWIVIVDIIVPSNDVLVNATGFKIGNTTRAQGKTIHGTTPGYYSYNQTAALASGDIKTFDADGFTIDKVAYAFACDIHWIVGR